MVHEIGNKVGVRIDDGVPALAQGDTLDCGAQIR